MKKYIFLNKCFNIHEKFPELRLGQIVFNSMVEDYPVFTEKYRASKIDPFYDNGKVCKFVNQCFDEIRKDDIQK